VAPIRNDPFGALSGLFVRLSGRGSEGKSVRSSRRISAVGVVLGALSVEFCNIFDEEEQEAHYQEGTRTTFTVSCGYTPNAWRIGRLTPGRRQPCVPGVAVWRARYAAASARRATSSLDRMLET
jgi:hypothetical protein